MSLTYKYVKFQTNLKSAESKHRKDNNTKQRNKVRSQVYWILNIQS